MQKIMKIAGTMALGLCCGAAAAAIAFAVIVILGGSEGRFGLYVITHGAGAAAGAAFMTVTFLDQRWSYRTILHPLYVPFLMAGFGGAFYFSLPVPTSGPVRTTFFLQLIPMILLVGITAGWMNWYERKNSTQH